MIVISLMVTKSSVAMANNITWSTTVSYLSEYYSRGISQTRGQPAPQILSTIYHSSGLYGGVFASRVEFFDNDEADLELDFYFGINRFLDNWNYRAGMVFFTYPNADNSLDYTFFEYDLAAGYNFKPLYTEASVRLSPNYFAGSGKSIYAKIAAKIPVKDFVFKGHFARRIIEDNAAFYGFPDNNDWLLGAEYKFNDKASILLNYVGSSFDEKTECLKVCSERLVLGLTYTF